MYDDIIYEYLDSLTDVNVYFANTRIDEPVKPYILVSEINNDEIHRDSEVGGVVTEFRRVTKTIGAYWDSKLPTNMATAKQTIALIRKHLKSFDCVSFFAEHEMTCRQENISSTRDLTAFVSGGFTYRFEFDVDFDYIDTLDTGKEVTKGVDVEIDTDESSIEFSA